MMKNEGVGKAREEKRPPCDKRQNDLSLDHDHYHLVSVCLFCLCVCVFSVHVFLCLHVCFFVSMCVFLFVCLSISVCVCLEVSKADILAGCSVSETTSLESRSGSATVFAETQARIEIDEFHCKARSSRRISEYLRISISNCVHTKI